jgi:putative ATP-dependent endonuclease of OLD family
LTKGVYNSIQYPRRIDEIAHEGRESLVYVTTCQFCRFHYWTLIPANCLNEIFFAIFTVFEGIKDRLDTGGNLALVANNSEMHVKKIVIENFKCFKGRFGLELNEGLNILVGDNESGKSTILEAINLALTGVLNGKYIRNELTQYLFNNLATNEYIESVENGDPIEPPHILIELYLEGDNLAQFEGDGNSKKERDCGLWFKIEFDQQYQSEYEKLIKSGELITIPIEYYTVNWQSFARERITSRMIPLKSSLIDSSTHRYQSGSDMYISRIVKDYLDAEDIVAISQAHRKLKEGFMNEQSIKYINTKLKDATNISDKDIKVSVDLSSKNAWETSLMTYLDDVPFHYIGKGEQTVIKTKLSLSHKKTKEANIILLEEPENHLSHSKLNRLISDLKQENLKKQVIISTHSSFVANKLGLGSLILLHDQTTMTFDNLTEGTKEFFEKLSGYDTLRLLLCNKAILVEGDSDELIIQKAYMSNHDGKLPIEDGIDVISVGTSFLRFLEIAEKINRPVVVVTDNDGDVEALKRKYENYLGENAKDFIVICFDEVVDDCAEIDGNTFNCNTLEPKLVKANGLEKMNEVLGTEFADMNEIHSFMKRNKTECALRVFNYADNINYPQYILDAISDEQ